MSIFIDRQFLLRVSPKLQKFTQKKEDLYNFRCPLCGDSSKNKIKARGYVYRKKNDYFYMCHNCGASTTFFNFLTKVDASIVKEYQLERYKNGETGNNNYKKPDFEEAKCKPVFREKIQLESIESLPQGHFAKTYVESRKIPKSFHSQLYFAPDFKKFIEELGVEKDGLIENDKRLIIPFFNKEKELVAVQGRALGESKIRYITVKIMEDVPKVFGLDRIDNEKMVYVVEGPIDSMFLENAVATADSHLEGAEHSLVKSNITLVFDNEPRNKEICKQIERAIENHFNVVIWPDFIQEKDINDMILDGFTSSELQDILENNTFVNLRAKMEFVNWKKC
jgi:transcription elongation factor Elf1